MSAAAPLQEVQASDLGMIPVEWDVDSLVGLGARITSGSRGWAKYYADYGDLFVRITNLRRSSIYLDLAQSRFVKVPSTDTEAMRTRLQIGDLLVSITADIGVIGFVDRSVPSPAYINQHIARVRFDTSRVSSKFVAYYLSSWKPQRLFVGSTDTGAKAGMNLATVGGLRTVVPPRQEQDRIADALEDADQLIITLERLIAKKQAIKQGMMQELLTGKTRLPGFGKPWREARLREAGSTYGGLSGKTKDDFGHGSATYVTFMEVMQSARLRGERLERVTVGASENQNRVKRGDLLFNGSSETPEEVALSAVVDFDPSPTTFLNSFCFGYRLNRHDLVDSTYLAYFFRSDSGRSVVSLLAQGAIRYNVSKTKLLELPLDLPPLNEQRAIVKVLTDSEAEINGLRHRLAKTRSIKQGMMQELLTGHTRLPISEAIA